jgi:hypothetical protein
MKRQRSKCRLTVSTQSLASFPAAAGAIQLCPKLETDVSARASLKPGVECYKTLSSLLRPCCQGTLTEVEGTVPLTPSY